jgi:16S rRNA (uracil1498-N3)-methyltransferase
VVESVGAGTLRLRLQAITLERQPDPRLVLVQALAKGDRDEQAIEAATELGVDEVVPWQAARSIVIWRGERAVRSLRKWESVVLAAAKQSRRSRVPVVSDPAGLAALTARIETSALSLVLHEDARLPLAGLALPESGEVLVIVGPEGGVAPDELSAFVAAGAVPVRLGLNVLRSSSAGPAALAVLSAAERWR